MAFMTAKKIVLLLFILNKWHRFSNLMKTSHFKNIIVSISGQTKLCGFSYVKHHKTLK